MGTGAAVNSVSLPWEVCVGPRLDASSSGRLEGGNDDRPMPMQKSDLLVVASKLVKAGGAKGEMD